MSDWQPARIAPYERHCPEQKLTHWAALNPGAMVRVRQTDESKWLCGCRQLRAHPDDVERLKLSPYHLPPHVLPHMFWVAECQIWTD